MELAADTPSQFIRYARGIQALSELAPGPKWRDVKVFVLAGPPGVGKTSLVYETFGYADVYPVASLAPVWFDRYSSQRVLLLDDIEVSLGAKVFLRMLDGHPYIAPRKGGSVLARYDRVCICTNYLSDLEGLQPNIRRRITDVFWLTGERGQYADLGRFIRDGGERPRGYELPGPNGRRILPSFVLESEAQAHPARAPFVIPG